MEIQRKSIVPTFLTAFLVCGALVIFCCVLTPYFTARPGQDQSSYLFEAERMLSGLEIYGPHLAETNPPMIVWFSALPVLFAKWTHGSQVFFLRLIVMVLIFCSITWCVRILRRGSAISSPYGLGFLTLAIVAIEFCIGAYNFGQREHLLIILILPYVVASATGVSYRLSVMERFALGAAAGIALWFKPHDVLVVAGLELFLALRGRSLRRVLAPEFLGLVATSLLVLALMRVVTPLYTEVTVPLLFDTYWALGTENAYTLARHLYYYQVELLSMVAASFLLRRYLRDPATSVALLVASVAAFIAFLVQHVNWWYHAYPHQALLLLALAYLVADLLYPFWEKHSSDSDVLRRTAFVASGCVAALLCVIAMFPRAVLTQGTHSGRSQLDDFLDQYQPSTTVYVFSTSIGPMAIAFNHSLNWGSRFAHLWMMPSIVQNELGPTGPPAPFKRFSPETLTRLATLQRTESAEDLNYWRPSVVLIEQCSVQHACQGMEGKDFDMLSWFLESPEFAAAWSHYERETEVDNFTVYKLVR